MSASPSKPDLTAPQSGAPDAGRPARDASGQRTPPPSPPPSEDAEAGARTPDEYTEPPGSHRRPEDGAALDVGG